MNLHCRSQSQSVNNSWQIANRIPGPLRLFATARGAAGVTRRFLQTGGTTALDMRDERSRRGRDSRTRGTSGSRAARREDYKPLDACADSASRADDTRGENCTLSLKHGDLV